MELLLSFLLEAVKIADKTPQEAIARAQAELSQPTNEPSQCYATGFLNLRASAHGACRKSYQAGVEDRVRALLTGELADI